MIGAAVGLIIGILNQSGLGFALTLMRVNMGSGNLMLLLLLAGAVCFVLGMGLPTLAVYILVATLIAPAMSERSQRLETTDRSRHRRDAPER
jgi:TRAP-type uncharacterized transport system fused permease subunit